VTKAIPTYSICSLDGHVHPQKDLAVYRLSDFMTAHADVRFPHRHSFYQVLFITSGGGEHIIDFESYPVKEGMLFLLSPPQVHEWRFNEHTDGILVNFNEHFFSSFLANAGYLKEFRFFSGNSAHSGIDLSGNRNTLLSMNTLFDRIVTEYAACDDCRTDLVRALLLQAFIETNYLQNLAVSSHAGKNNFLIFKNFEKLIAAHFKSRRLPKEYARLLFITPNHLNALCKQIAGKPAGELIRDRIILEAKRLLVNSELNIGEIALALNFEDNSYFTRFFRKAENLTPEEFRKLKQR